MYIIKEFLDQGTLARMTEMLKQVEFANGGKTAFGMARNVKKNTQLDAREHPEVVRELSKLIQQNPTFRTLSMPVRMTPPRIARYTEGMEYGNHSDNAVIAGVRTDLSFTLFLSAPSSYEGGELVLELPQGETKVKLPAGSLVLYDSGCIHRVNPVRAGERLVAVGWVQSRIRDSLQRQTIVDLEGMRASYLKAHGHDRHADLLLKTSANLQRMWSQI